MSGLGRPASLVRTSSWRAGHAFNVTLPGWLVLVPTRHVTSFAQLSPQARAELGVLTEQLSGARRPSPAE